MIIETAVHPQWISNTYLVAEGEGGAAVFVDSGGPVEALLKQVCARRLRVTHILNTHRHGDHVACNDVLKRETGARLCAHRMDAVSIGGVDEPLDDNQVITTGGLEIRVLHIPGHTSGQAAFVVNGALCFTGDTLFRRSIGSTTAPGHTTFVDLRHSLVERLLGLPDATRILPGHAEETTVGEERAGNPFLRVMLGLDPEGRESARYEGRDVRLIVRARDYDGGTKAWIRFPDGEDATVPGSRVSIKPPSA